VICGAFPKSLLFLIISPYQMSGNVWVTGAWSDMLRDCLIVFTKVSGKGATLLASALEAPPLYHYLYMI
jgi:hypothetical protein